MILLPKKFASKQQKTLPNPKVHTRWPRIACKTDSRTYLVSGEGCTLKRSCRHVKNIKSAGGIFITPQNRGVNEDQNEAERGRGRLSTSRRGVMELLEQEKQHVCHCKSCALLKTRIAMCLRLLDICESGTECATPTTGGGALRTSVGAQRQLVHADGWTLQGDCTGDKHFRPGVFTIATGKDETPSWVCCCSHWTAPVQVGTAQKLLEMY